MRRAGLAWSPDEEAKLLLMASAGFTIRTAAEQLERTPKSIRARYCQMKRISWKAVLGTLPDAKLSSLDAFKPTLTYAKPFMLMPKCPKPFTQGEP